MLVSPTLSGGSDCSFVVAEFAAFIGDLPSEAWSSIRTSVPTRVSGWITTWWPRRQPAPSVTFAPMTQNSPSVAPAPIEALGWMTLVTGPPPATARWRSAGGRGAGVGAAVRGVDPLAPAQPAEPVGERALPLAYALHEVEALEPERLLEADLRDQDVAAADRECVPVGNDLPRPVHALVVHLDLLARFHVVEHHHLLRADDGELAQLVRIEPGHVHVRALTAREAEVHEHDVLDPRLQERGAARGHVDRLLVHEGQDHGRVVGREAPERVFVLAHLPRA